MKKTLIPLVILTLVAVNSCNPSRKATSRAPGQELTLINIGAYANDPAADRARQAFDKTNKGLEELNRLKTYNLEEEELAILRGATVTTTELNRISGVNAPVQGQIDNLQAQANDTITLQDVVMRKHRLFNHQSGTSYSLVLSDDSKIITMSSVSANTLTIPTNALVPFQIGTKVDVIQLGEGQTSITGATGVIVNTSKYLKLSRYGLASLLKTAENSWIVYGDLDTTGLASNPPPAPTVPTTGLYGHWKFEQNANDSFGSYNGTATDVTYVAGVDGYAASFNGTSSRIALGNVIKPTNALTVSFWMKDGGQTAEKNIINTSTYDNGWRGWRLTRYNNQVAGVFLSSDSNDLDVTYGTNLSDDTWRHIVFTWDGITAYVYINNVRNNGWTWSETISYADTHNLMFGANQSGGNVFDGEIDELRIYNVALDASGVEQLYREFD